MAAAAVTAGIAMVRSGLQVIDKQAKLAASLRTTTESLQVLTRAGDLAGVSMGEIQQATIQLAELACAGLTPDWMPGAVPRCVPVETRRNQHGEREKTEVVGIERVLFRGRWRTIELLACPVTWRPHLEQIAGARRAYEDWWLALGWVRDGLVGSGMLQEVDVTPAMPKKRPWAC